MRRPLGLAGAGARWPWGSWWPSSPCAGGAVDSTVLSLSWEHGGRPQCSFLLIQRPGGGIRGTPAPRIRALREMWSFMCIISGCFSLWVSVNAWSSVTWFLSLSFPCQFSGLPLPPTFNYVFFCSGFFSRYWLVLPVLELHLSGITGSRFSPWCSTLHSFHWLFWGSRHIFAFRSPSRWWRLAYHEV